MAGDDTNGLEITTKFGSMSAHGTSAFVTLLAALLLGAIGYVLHDDHVHLTRQMDVLIKVTADEAEQHKLQSWILTLPQEKRENLGIKRPVSLPHHDPTPTP